MCVISFESTGLSIVLSCIAPWFVTETSAAPSKFLAKALTVALSSAPAGILTVISGEEFPETLFVDSLPLIP